MVNEGDWAFHRLLVSWIYIENTRNIISKLILTHPIEIKCNSYYNFQINLTTIHTNIQNVPLINQPIF